MKKRLLGIVLIFLIGYLVRYGLDSYYEKTQYGVGQGSVTEYTDGTRVGRELNYAPNVAEDHPLLTAFTEWDEEAEVLVACEEDLTNDGVKDLAVIYTTAVDDEHVTASNRGKHRHTRLAVVIGSEDASTPEFTEPVPAPVENQKIQFKNIDQQDEIEFVVQGSKNGKVGYGIFRVEDKAVINLFGEGMEEC